MKPAKVGLSRRACLAATGGGLGALTLTAGFGPASAFAASPAKSSLKRVAIVNTSSINTYVLQKLIQDQGFLKDFDLDAHTVNVMDGIRVIDSLLGGETDICLLSGFGQVLSAIERGAKLKVVGGAGLLLQHAVYSAKPEIRTVKDLVGKTIGTGSPGALLYQLMVLLLQRHGIRPSHVRFVNIGSSADVFRAVAAGKVDAGPSLMGLMAEEKKFGVHTIAELWKDLPEYTYQGSYTSDQAITNKRDVLVRTLAAYAKLYRFISSPASKTAYLTAYEAVTRDGDPTVGEMEWRFAQIKNAYAVSLVLSPARIDYMQKINIETGAQKKVLPFDEVADMSIARDALKLLG